MANILLALELGGGFGHARRLAAIGKGLRLKGHRVVLATPAPQKFSTSEMAEMEVVAISQWPRVQASVTKTAIAATFGDLLAQLLFADGQEIADRLGLWDDVFAASGAEVIIADYAPGAVLAARGRIPIVNIGDSYYLPPPDMQSFPRLFKTAPMFDEPEVMARVNEVLRSRAAPVLTSLPDVARAEVTRVTNFPALDIYASLRKDVAIGPLGPMPAMAMTNSKAMFGYFNSGTEFNPRIVNGLLASGVPGKVVIPGMRNIPRIDPLAAGLRFTGQPVDLVATLANVSVMVTHGGAQTVAAGMAAGVPQVIVAMDDEKRLIGRCVEQAGIGISLRGENLQSADLAEAIREVNNTAHYRKAARKIAAECQAMLEHGPTQKLFMQIDELLERR